MPRTPAPRPPAHRTNPAAVPDPVARPLDDVAGDIRDRLTVLINAAQMIRLTIPADDARMQSVLRLISQQVESLGRLADELCRSRWPDPEADGDAAPHPSADGP